MSKDEALRRVAGGADPSRLGRAAHVPQDWAWQWGAWWCWTLRNPEWHEATPTEAPKIRRLEASGAL